MGTTQDVQPATRLIRPPKEFLINKRDCANVLMGTLITKISYAKSVMKVVRPVLGRQFISAPNVKRVERLTVPKGASVGLTSWTKAVNVSARNLTTC